jgi:hypothetical protein
MRIILVLFSVTIVSLVASAQEESDSVMRRCPVYITDTLTSNNFFLEAQPCTLSVSRVKGELKVVVQQRDQYFSIFFRQPRLKYSKYKIKVAADDKDEVEAKYSFRSGDQVSYVNVANGTIETVFDKEKKLWRLKLNGMIANLVERNITYYRVRTELFFP